MAEEDIESEEAVASENEEEGFVPSEEVSAEEIWYRGELLRSIDKILKDEIAEENLKDFPLWVAYAKTTKLTFLDERDVAVLENLFEAEVCRYLRSLPPTQQKPEVYKKIGQARMTFYMNLRRSLGKGDINERTAIASLMKFVMVGEMKQKKPGFLERLRGGGE
ncbi:MAG: hypothetical protein LM587_01565 [Candidatus Aenigmarchaeota archaeon]|nr:hypothetical protein [Candidatus Aenigmarchaeota archaeon]